MKEIKLFNPDKNKPRPSKDDIRLSEDVCIIDENNLNGVAYYNFECQLWKIHSDTFVDYDYPGEETKQVWYYPPFSKSDVEEFYNK